MKRMKVLLREDVKKLGNKGEIIEVAEGYAISSSPWPAVEASTGVVKEVSLVKKGQGKKEARQSRRPVNWHPAKRERWLLSKPGRRRQALWR